MKRKNRGGTMKRIACGVTMFAALGVGAWLIKDRVSEAHEATLPPVISGGEQGLGVPERLNDLGSPSAALPRSASDATTRLDGTGTADTQVGAEGAGSHVGEDGVSAPSEKGMDAHVDGEGAGVRRSTGGSSSDAAAIAASGGHTGVLLVNEWHPLPDGYVAEDLVVLYDQKRSFSLASSDIELNREAFEAANRMFAQARRDGIDGFILTSGYRTREKQRALYEADTEGTAAKPGASEHESGLAFDVTAYRGGGGFEETEQYRWLIENCWAYGYILRYPEAEEDVTGIPFEPWHFRYVGVDVAREIQEDGLTLEAFCQRDGG